MVCPLETVAVAAAVAEGSSGGAAHPAVAAVDRAAAVRPGVAAHPEVVAAAVVAAEVSSEVAAAATAAVADPESYSFSSMILTGTYPRIRFLVTLSRLPEP